MGVEIERKFLVEGDDWRTDAGEGEAIVQAYLLAEKTRSVRVRCRAGQGTLTVKGKTEGASRPEFEYEIPLEDVDEIIAALDIDLVIRKTRHELKVEGHLFEIDVFAGDNEGLVVAEIELEHEAQDFPRPAWLGEEITENPRYYNANLARRPFSD